MTEEERMAGHLDVMRRGGFRSGFGDISYREPETIYPPSWRPPTRKRDQ